MSATTAATVAAKYFTWPDSRARLESDIAEAIDAAVRAERERCAALARSWAAHYPEDVFLPPPPAEQMINYPSIIIPIDRASANMARHSAEQIARLIEKGQDDD